MKNTVLPAVLTAIIMLGGGCASSDRAFRMSGDILGSYSAPKSYRLRSEKFRQMEQMSIPHRAKRPELSGFNDPLINIWPFYFRNRNYFSILWPMVDWDPYGMAIRPFYNQEGDDYSILFPLSSWNPAERSGWVANFRWTDDGFGFIPLTWQQRSKEKFHCYYTPFFICRRDYRQCRFNHEKERFIYNTGDLTEFLLAYYGVDHSLDTGKWHQLFFREPLKSDRVKYLLWKSGRPMPENQADIKKLRKEFEKDFVRYETTYGGFFPLFHYKQTPYKKSYNWNILHLLAAVDKNSDAFSLKIGGGGLFSRKTRVNELFYSVIHGRSSSSEFFILPLLSKWEQNRFIKPTPLVENIRQLYHTVRNSNSFADALPRAGENLKKLDPQAEIPEFINNSTLLQFYIEDYLKEFCRKQKFEFYTTVKNGCLPIYFHEKLQNKESWFSLLLLSGGKTNHNGSWSWLSLPLLSGGSCDEYKQSLYIAPPFIYSNTTRRFDPIGKYIHSSDAKWPQSSGDTVENNDIYAGCGLFYRGYVKFITAKPGINFKELNRLINSFKRLSREKRYLDSDEESYAKELKLANAITHRNKIEYYEKMLALEKLKLRRNKLDLRHEKFKAETAKAGELAEKLKFDFSISDWSDPKQLHKILSDLYKNCTVVREKSDIGNGLFFRKELFYNGDWKWQLLFNLAGGEKDGSRESSHILHFLYRNRTDGDKSEKIFFPFVSIQRDGSNSRISFLGRIFQKSEINGKRSGYIFFIPFGSKD